jgi:ABC-type branched-subunit amino acid transport system permease subunit
MFAAAACAGLIGFLIALPTLRARGHYLAMVTIALAIVTFVIAQTWIPVTNGPTGIGNIPRPEWFGGSTMGSLRKFRPFGEDGPTLTGQVLYFWVCAGLLLIVQFWRQPAHVAGARQRGPPIRVASETASPSIA